jgi:hypothetical protein
MYYAGSETYKEKNPKSFIWQARANDKSYKLKTQANQCRQISAAIQYLARTLPNWGKLQTVRVFNRNDEDSCHFCLRTEGGDILDFQGYMRHRDTSTLKDPKNLKIPKLYPQAVQGRGSKQRLHYYIEGGYMGSVASLLFDKHNKL